VFGGFAANELAARIDDAQPAVIGRHPVAVEPARTVDYKPHARRRARSPEHAASLRDPAARAAAV